MVRILEADAEKAKAAASYVLWDLSRDTILLAGAIPVLIDLLSGELDEFCGEKLAMRIKGGLLAGREASALELYKLESGSPKSNWQLISDIKRRTNTTGLGEEDMLCIMSGPIEDADGSSVILAKQKESP
ncbi:unnamed protein product [Musa acuminata var. zebrina]